MSTWRPTPPEHEPRPVADSLDRLAGRLGAPRSSVLAAIFSRWEDLVGPDIAAHSQPISLRQKVLVLSVDHPAWATQLQYLTSELLSRIESAAGPGEVREIRLKVAP
jgi:predicted nucleic acid-binding Zn ribbon protein